MAADALQRTDTTSQLPLYEPAIRARQVRPARPVCAGCRAREARYGFRVEGRFERPRTLCFDCFRIELTRRQMVAERMARGWNASQVRLPLAETLEAVSLRRRRAQIAARKALGV